MIDPAPSSRRRFLGLIAAGGAVVATGGVLPILLRDDDGVVAVDLLHATPDTFSPFVGDEFRLGGSTVRLSDVTRLGGRSYALRFDADGHDLLAQGTYSVSHRRLHPFELFVVPGAASYGAIVNHEVS